MTVMMQGKLSEIVRFMIFHFQLFNWFTLLQTHHVCLFFPLIGERENLVLFLFKCTIYKNAHFFHVKLMKMKVFLNAINDV